MNFFISASMLEKMRKHRGSLRLLNSAVAVWLEVDDMYYDDLRRLNEPTEEDRSIKSDDPNDLEW